MKKSDQEKYAEARFRQQAPAREAARQKLIHSETPNPKKITIALDYRMLYGPEVDEALGVAEPMVDWWEAGTVIPTPEEMMKLAELTHFPVEFFYGEVPEIEHFFVCGRGVK